MVATKVYIIEDDRTTIEQIKKILDNADYVVVGEATDGETAVSQAKSLSPDLILLSTQLHGQLDGLQTAEALEKILDIPLIYVTPADDALILEKTALHSPYGYLHKPINEWKLLAVIQMALYRHRMEKQLGDNRRWLQTILASLGDAVIATDAQHQIRFMNGTAERLTGWRSVEMRGKRLRDVFNLASTAILKKERRGFLTMVPNRALQDTDFLVTSSGQFIPIEYNLAPIRDENGQLLGSVVVFRDISHRKKAESEANNFAARLQMLHEIDLSILTSSTAQEIAESTLRKIRELIQCQRASIVEIDPTNHRGFITAIDSNRETLLSVGETIPLSAETFAHLDSNRPFLINDLDARESLSPIQEMLRSEGIRAYLSAPLIAQGKLIGLLNLGDGNPATFEPWHLDFATEVATSLAIALHQARLNEQIRRHSENLAEEVEARTAELAQANVRLHALEQLKSRLIDDISHELRTPVTNLALYIDLLVNGPPERHTKYIDVLKNQIGRLTELVEGVIRLAKSDLMHGEGKFAAVSLNTLLQEIFWEMKPEAEKAGLTLALHLTPDLPPIFGSAWQLAEVARQLIFNAIAYTQKGDIEVRTAYGRFGYAGFLVKDSGIGIPAGELEFLFDRFYRSSLVSQLNKPGIGLGLSLVKEIIDMHQGEISVESTVNKGSTFLVWLPIATNT